MKILAIVVTYNGMEWYERCFSSLKDSSMPIDIFVVDNASSDDTVEYIKYNFSQIILIESPINLGFGQANNKGLRYALENNYDYVFLLNQDAWIEPETIKKLIDAYQTNPKYAIISPIQLYGNGMRMTTWIEKHIVDAMNKENDLFSDIIFNRKKKSIYDVNYVCAASWLISIETLKVIGGFDPVFFHYGEDDNYIQRIKFHGFKLGLCPESFICHDVEFRGDDSKKNNNWKKNFLVYLTDINRELNINKKIAIAIVKMIKSLISLRYKSCQLHLKTIKLMISMKQKIELSYTVNKKRGTNWL